MPDESEIEGLPDFINDEKDTPWQPDYNLLTNSFNAITTGMDLPSQIFSIAIHSFNFNSGLFLTFESDSNLFIPFASLGIDETSLRRCRIELKYIQENNLVFSGSEIYSGISKNIFKKYLSKRLWDTIENIDIMLISYHDIIFGLLLLFNSTTSENPKFKDFASLFTRKSSEFFYNSRSRIINTLPKPVDPPITVESFHETLTGRLAKFSDKTFENTKIIFIDYKDIIDTLIENDETIDHFIVENNIFSMYNSMLFGSSFIIKITECRIVIVFLSGLTSNNSIIENQMTASLLSLFDKSKIFNKPKIVVSEIQTVGEDLADRINDFVIENL